jgi:hypothetical protein
MQLSSSYYFEGKARLSYGWDNPNHIAAIIVALIPFLWAATTFGNPRPVRQILFFIVEAFACLLVALTYSRGAAVALILSLCVFVGLMPRMKRDSWSLFFLSRLGIITILIMSSGLNRRFELGAAGEPSTFNRLDLWTGGLRLIHASPLWGWGKGNAGVAYMQWVQDPFSEVVHHGMVNSYLQLGVEFGLLSLILYLLVIIFMVLVALRARPNREPSLILSQGAAFGLIAFSIAAFFSTLVTVPSVLWLPIVLIALVVGFAFPDRKYELLKLAGSAGIAAGTIALTLYGIGVYASSDRQWLMRLNPDDTLTFSSNKSENGGKTIVIMADGRCLGPYYGKQIRRSLLQVSLPITSVTVVPPQVVPPNVFADRILLLGASVSILGQQSHNARTIIVCPVSHVPKTRTGLAPLLILSEYDQLGYGQEWERYALAQSWQIMKIRAVGQDVSARLPTILSAALANTPTL